MKSGEVTASAVSVDRLVGGAGVLPPSLPPVLKVQGHVNTAVQCRRQVPTHRRPPRPRSPVQSIGGSGAPSLPPSISRSTNTTITTSLPLSLLLPLSSATRRPPPTARSTATTNAGALTLASPASGFSRPPRAPVPAPMVADDRPTDGRRCEVGIEGHPTSLTSEISDRSRSGSVIACVEHMRSVRSVVPEMRSERRRQKPNAASSVAPAPPHSLR